MSSFIEFEEAAKKIDFLYLKNGINEGEKEAQDQVSYRNLFKKLYNPGELKKYNGIEVWNKVWQHGPGGMIYALRNDDKFRCFGSAQSQDTHGLPMHQTKEGNYYAGKNNEIIGQKEALAYGEKYRNKFIQCITYVENSTLESVEDFEKLGEILEDNLDGRGKQMWVHKYLHMFFPDKFSQFHSSEFKRDILCALGIVPNDSFYGMAGQLYEIKKRTNIDDYYLFAQVMYKNFPGVGRSEVYLVNAREEALEKIKNWVPGSNVEININDFYDLWDNPRFSAKTSEDDEKNHLFVVMDQDTPLGIFDSLDYKKDSKKTEIRYGKWHACFLKDDKINYTGSRKKAISKPEILVLIYKRFYSIYTSNNELNEIIENNYERYEAEFSSYKEEIDAFLAAYPLNINSLKAGFNNDGILLFYRNIECLNCIDGENIDFSSISNYEKNDLAFYTMNLILGKQVVEGFENLREVISRILALYYPDEYVAVSDEETLDFIIDELSIPSIEGHNLLLRQRQVKNWVGEKLGLYTKNPYMQNYIFVRAVKDMIGDSFTLNITNKGNNTVIHALEPDVIDEYESLDTSDEKEISKLKSIPDEVSYKRTPQPKEYVEEKDNAGRYIPKRDPRKRLNAMVLADFKCEIDPTHETFISRSTNRQYVESHHLIPMEFHEDFNSSLDVEENIVCLCSNCHNKIHYGIDNDVLIKQLFEKRKSLLHDAGLDISEEQLLRDIYKTSGY
ncbi:HNH endonuclease [Pseudobutyrivibrio ruminis]|uniref:HNH endonuclease n=1 Tax=Pseudobutyrivibrio ruminis DSM 9787 TaxID=1123011 RepID=A0A285TD51_9FIRM|nr:HNH endonuclease [Pseudobutyrivibrio ruminis]SOC17843.1 HNH endonuclease [Pseudobutyrivibrio ruminis DSM 9787]